MFIINMLMALQIFDGSIYSVNGVRAIICVFGKKYIKLDTYLSIIYKANFRRVKELSSKHKVIKNWRNTEYF